MDEGNAASHRANVPVAERLAAKVNAMAAEAGEGEGESEFADAGSSGESATDTVVETAIGDTTTEATAVADSPEKVEAKARATRLALFEEKLKAKREENKAKQLAKQAKADRLAAQQEREAAAAERKKYDGLKTGSFKETLEALGRDPRQTWEEMNREAIEASTPEAQARRADEERQRALDERFKPVLSELEQLREERKQWAAQTHERNLVSNYQQAAADPKFAELRVEYPDEALLDHAKYYDKNPDHFRVAAKEYGVPLTAPEKGFTMHELLSVLAAAQAAHNEGVRARRAALSPAEPQSAAPPTVNGTAPRRNAATAVGNDLASQRASAKFELSGLSPKERMRARADAEIRRSGG